MSRPTAIRIVEVGPRDGLQNEPVPVPIATRADLIDRLTAAGLTMIEAGSFVSPKWVPQMAGTDEVLRQIHRRPGVRYSVLVPNLQGLASAENCDVDEIAIFASASETFSKANINCSISESLERLTLVTSRALAEGLRVRGYVSCALGCPYEGEITLAAVASVTRALYEMGCYEISLGDTIGVGTPIKARRMLEHVAQDIPIPSLALHFHDTYGQALANILECLETGVAVIDSAVAGLGGCPYANGATGNVATEDLIYMLDGMGIETGVSLDGVISAGQMVTTRLGRKTGSRVAKARGSTAAYAYGKPSNSGVQPLTADGKS